MKPLKFAGCPLDGLCNLVIIMLLKHSYLEHIECITIL
uniref:Uncharacterized protein n=1 Tax=Setaria italica TaxID=4555 RepID=K3Y4D1_SETIT